MAPKGKPKAKGKAKDKGRGEEETDFLPVPGPPPEPVCLPLPEALARERGGDRCLLLGWSDHGNNYKLQLRPVVPGEHLDRPGQESAWVDATDRVRIPWSSNNDFQARLVSCEPVRLQYRLVAVKAAEPINGLYVANWSSAPSQPVASYVDPPTELEGKLHFDAAAGRHAVLLSWKSANSEMLARILEEDKVCEYGPFAAHPGILPVRLQVRWRCTRVISDADSLPIDIRSGRRCTSVPIQHLVEDAAFDERAGVWQYCYNEAAHGIAASFQVRVGTSFRWSSWSDESGEVIVDIPEPKPAGLSHPEYEDDDDVEHDEKEFEVDEYRVRKLQPKEVTLEVECVKVDRVSDRSCVATWASFEPWAPLTAIEYRVQICSLDDEKATPDWQARGTLMSNFVSDVQGSVSSVIRGLHPNTWYVVSVDARYAHVGKRSFSLVRAKSMPFYAPFSSRPPLQPLPVTIEELVEEEDRAAVDLDEEDQSVVKGEFAWTFRASWAALSLERECLDEYDIEYKSVSVSGASSARDHYQGWRAPVAVKVHGDISMSTGLASISPEFHVVYIGFPEDVHEVVTCRLRHKQPLATISALQWSVESPPIVPFVAPPTLGHQAFWPVVTDHGVRYFVRFFLHPGMSSPTEHGGHFAPPMLLPGLEGEHVPKFASPPLSAPLSAVSSSPPFVASVGQQPVVRRGHRFVSRYQFRVRPKGQHMRKSACVPWTKLSAAVLPKPIPPVLQVDAAKLGEQHNESTKEIIAMRLGLRGLRFEVDVDPSSIMRNLFGGGGGFEIELRVGSDVRWSAWVPIFEPDRVAEPFPHILPPMPERFEGEHAKLECRVLGPTKVSLSWAPFKCAPGITQLEYVVRATPRQLEGRAQLASEGWTPGGSQLGMSEESIGCVERTVRFDHPPGLSDDDLVASKEVLSVLQAVRADWKEELLEEAKGHQESEAKDGVEAFPSVLDTALAMVQSLRDRERSLNLKDDRRLTVELAGLLPCMQYELTVYARYVGLSVDNSIVFGDAIKEFQLQAMVSMPGGESAPAIPHTVAPPSPSEDRGPGERGVMLCIEDRCGYVLEYRAATSAFALYDAYDGSDRNRFCGSWQGGDPLWRRVNAKVEIEGGQAESGSGGTATKIVWAQLPQHFSGGSWEPDAVEFRLCVESPTLAHPCRWVTGSCDPVATCFAPVRSRPKSRRLHFDDRWCLQLAFEMFKSAPVPDPVRRLGEVCDGDDSADDDAEALEFRKSFLAPTVKQETWSDSILANIPVGYGHRMATFVQLRHTLQGAVTPVLRKQLEEKSLSRQWQQQDPLSVEHLSFEGRHCTLTLGSDSVGLLDGGIYAFQVRIGDGSRWSAWSHSSSAVGFHVPEPQPAGLESLGHQQPVMVDPISSSTARLRWCDFTPAAGLTMLEYMIEANPQQSQQSLRDLAAITVRFEHRYRGGWVEREVKNLRPFTPYIFTVSARYPRIGSRKWCNTQTSSLVNLERPSPCQDPPPPQAVQWPSGDMGYDDMADREAIAATGIGTPFSSVLLEFPDEEDGAAYDLEFAHILGDEHDSAELRTNQRLWLVPDAIIRVENHGADSCLPRWLVHLPDIRPFRSDPLKLAVLQRVRFRLRARFSAEDVTTRWWSSLSAPVCTGFAVVNNVLASLVVSNDGLQVEVSFSLDKRLGELAVSSSREELRRQREAVLDSLATSFRQSVEKSDRLSARNVGLTEGAPVPRGFGHSFVTRYQLRVRYQKVGESSGSWEEWEIATDAALPVESTNSLAVMGLFGARDNTRARCFSVPLSHGAILNTKSCHSGASSVTAQVRRAPRFGDTVQVGVRIGDGSKWSAWRDASELAVAVEPPRAREIDIKSAFAEWIGDTCTIKWPPAVVHPGLDTIEYQVLVNPTSPVLPVRLGALVIGAALSSVHSEIQSVAFAGMSIVTKASPPKVQEWKRGVAVQDSGVFSRRRLVGPAGGGRIGPDAEMMLSVDLEDLCTDLSYGFTILGRYPTIGPRSFVKLFEVAPVSWSMNSEGPPGHGDRASSTNLALHALPILEQVPVPHDGRLCRWYDQRFVMVTWPGLRELITESGKDELLGGVELQTCRVDVDELQRGEDSESWCPCMSYVTLEGRAYADDSSPPCVAVRELPSFVCRLRLFDSLRQTAGRPSKPLVALYESIPKPPQVELQALGQRAPRSLGVHVSVSLKSDSKTLRLATFCQVRFRVLEACAQTWQQLEMGSIDASRCNDEMLGVIVREEDGLELGFVYEFAVRVGDRCRFGPWSEASRPVGFRVPSPIPSGTTGIRTQVTGDSAHLTWETFQAEPALLVAMPTFIHLEIEYVLTVYRGHSSEPITRFVTCNTRADVHALAPATSYTVSLVARWTRFGGERTHIGERELLAAFVTELASHQVVAQLSLRYLNAAAEVSPPAVATFRIGAVNEMQAMKLDLDPYYARLRQPRSKPYFTREHCRPFEAPNEAEFVESGAIAPSASSSGSLPSLPPKFCVRGEPQLYEPMNRHKVLRAPPPRTLPSPRRPRAKARPDSPTRP